MTLFSDETEITVVTIVTWLRLRKEQVESHFSLQSSYNLKYKKSKINLPEFLRCKPSRHKPFVAIFPVLT